MTERPRRVRKGRGNRRKPEEYQSLDRMRRVAHHTLNGKSQWEIARIEGVTQARICQLLKKVREQWWKESLVDLAEHKARKLAEINHMKAICLKGIARSSKVSVVKAEKMLAKALKGYKSEDGKDKPQLMSAEKNGRRACDPRFILCWTGLSDQENKVLGLYQDVNLTQTTVNVFDGYAKAQEVPDVIEAKLIESLPVKSTHNGQRQ